MKDPVLVQLLQEIDAAELTAALRCLRDEAHRRMDALFPSLPLDEYYRQLNGVHDALIRRTVALAEAELARSGMGSPPVPYAYLLFGSGGRKEQTLSSDQDSGIIYEDAHSDEETLAAQKFFTNLSARAVALLQEIGYPPCEGNVISSNPQWCQPESEWKRQLESWFETADWEAVRYLLIVADCRHIHGSGELLERLKRHYYSDMLAKPVIVQRMLDNTIRHKMLIGVFGQLLKEQYGEDAGSIDIKYGAYIPMVNAVRLMAVQSQLRPTSTLERLHALEQAEVVTAEEAAAYSEAFLFFLKLRMIATENNEDGMYMNNGKLANHHLTKEMTEELKQSLKVGKRLQRQVQKLTLGKLK
ncbi:DUF294 nucleotidyltransferase-like domain-containing protein [Paenibacillus sp. GCM10012307]|uniref:CBS domain-containing protein n=1 Tax=Paenibacillus roseus TaxID=2798579 RepID=A0A934IY61_9BACL|nr:DUF294 nucleotidyltransferase-like domain-containing protein [Paenibacillus roseus]MBJ6359849.1 hypothetical protein [Paenibacillus roseus]